MFESLSQQLTSAIERLKGTHRISEINIASTLKDIRRALVSADVSYQTAKALTATIKAQALGEKVLQAVSPGQLFTKITQDALSELMGASHQELSLSNRPSVILVVGLQGSGKTTFCAKLGLHLKKKGMKVLLVAGDLSRPAAIEQLETLGQQAQLDVFSQKEAHDPIALSKEAMAYAKQASTRVVIVDTAGRLAIDEPLMDELQRVRKVVRPEEVLFVADAMTGQDAVQTATRFDEALDLDGVVLTKLDGDARGGAALSIKTATQKPIKLISYGENLESLDVFHPERMASRILGMGDVVSFVEKTQQSFEEAEARALAKKFHKNTFDLEDFLAQLQKIKKMGNIKELLHMIPGLGKQAKTLDVDEKTWKMPEVIIRSMTPLERRKPQVLDHLRKQRIAKGSGTTIQDINEVLKRYEGIRKMMKRASQKQPLMPGLGQAEGIQHGHKKG